MRRRSQGANVSRSLATTCLFENQTVMTADALDPSRRSGAQVPTDEGPVFTTSCFSHLQPAVTMNRAQLMFVYHTRGVSP